MLCRISKMDKLVSKVFNRNYLKTLVIQIKKCPQWINVINKSFKMGKLIHSSRGCRLAILSNILKVKILKCITWKKNLNPKSKKKLKKGSSKLKRFSLIKIKLNSQIKKKMFKYMFLIFVSIISIQYSAN